MRQRGFYVNIFIIPFFFIFVGRKHLLNFFKRRIDRLIAELSEKKIANLERIFERLKRGDERNIPDFFAICVSTLEEMICAKDRYFGLNRILMLAIGLWPYEQSKLVRLQLTLHYGILGSFIVFQFTTFVTSKCDVQLIIEILSITSFFLIFVITYISFLFNMDVVKHLLELLQLTYDEIRDKGEIAIIEKYWSIAKRYTKILTLLVILGMIFFIFCPFLPYTFNIMFSANESRPRPSLQIITEYFIDQERYFYLIILHADVAYCIGTLAMLAPGTILITYIQHICGMLKIASYRMERIMTIRIVRMNNMKNANLICKSIIYAVDMHRKALKIVQIFISSFDITFVFLILNGLLYASLNLYRIFREISSGCIGEKLIQSLIILNIYYVYTFLANDMAQQVMDHNNSMFTTVYNVQWYVAPLHVQKLILFLLQRGTKTFKIMIGRMFMGSLEGCATLVSASMSYFTFIYYTNQ